MRIWIRHPGCRSGTVPSRVSSPSVVGVGPCPGRESPRRSRSSRRPPSGPPGLSAVRPPTTRTLHTHIRRVVYRNLFKNIPSNAVLRIRDVYPGSRILIFVHPGSRIQKQQQKRGVKKICCPAYFCSHKNHKIENNINFELVTKKNLGQFTTNIELLLLRK